MSLNMTTTAMATRSDLEITIIVLVLIIMILASVIGNITVIAAIYTSHHLQEDHSNLFIINISITDITMSMVVMASSLVSVTTDSWPLGVVWCDIVCMVNYCLIIVSMLTLSFISIDRYVTIVMPLHNIMTRTKILAMIAYAWFQAAVFSAVPVVFRWVEYDYWEGICAIQWQHHRREALIYVIMAFVMCFFIPGLVLFVAYSCVLKVTKNKIPSVMDTSSCRDMVKYRTSYKAMYGLIAVVVVFFVCMTPFSVTKLYKVAVTEDNALPNYVNLSASIIAYMSSVVNPLIYGIFRRDFRQAIRMVFRKYLANMAVTPQPRSTSMQLDDLM